MSIATLGDIIVKVRKLTGSANNFQLTDAQIIDYINSFYLYDFPANYRALKLKDKYTFNTIAGIDVYPFDSEHYTTIETPCYCQNRLIPLFQSPSNFWGLNYNWQFQQTLTQGASPASVGPYSGTLSNVPIIRSVNNNPMVTTQTSSTNVFPAGNPITFPQANIGRVQNILITTTNSLGVTQNITDDGAGILIGDGTGTINYENGIIDVTFNIAVTPGADIKCQYLPANMNIPLSIMFFQNQFTLRPCPDQGYKIELIAYRLPSQALLGSLDPDAPDNNGVPEQREWWECIAFGAAKKIYEDRLDPDGVSLMERSLIQQYSVAETRTYAEIGKQRVPSIYAQQLDVNVGYGWGTGWGFGAGGSQ